MTCKPGLAVLQSRNEVITGDLLCAFNLGISKLTTSARHSQNAFGNRLVSMFDIGFSFWLAERRPAGQKNSSLENASFQSNVSQSKKSIAEEPCYFWGRT